MRKALVHCFATVLIALASAQHVRAQDDKMTPTAIPAQPSAIRLATGPLPGATVKESWHSQYGSAFARNVTEATLTPFLPSPGTATGAAVIVAPGGGFRVLSMQNEGWRSEEHTSELQSQFHLVCRLLLEKKKHTNYF